MKCSKCGAEFQGKFCPECGAKAENEEPLTPPPIQEETNTKQDIPPAFNTKIAEKNGKHKSKKPFYKKWWFILIAVVLVLCVIAALAGNKGSKKDKIDWSSMILKDVIPNPPSNKGTLYENSDEELKVNLDNVTDEQYNTYLNECIDLGFTVDADKTAYLYEAYNKEGYSLELRHTSDDLDITLKTAMQMGTISWPTGTAGSLIPAPKSTTGKFDYEHDKSFSVYVGDTSQADYDEYVTACSDKGFTVDYDKGEKYYRADNAEGYHLSLSYEGNNIMLVRIDKPNEEEISGEIEDTSEAEASPTAKPTAKPTEEVKPTEEAASTDDSNSSSVGADGLRTDFKEAMDSYESFMGEYCEFMKKYNENPSDLNLLADYATYVSKYADVVNKFDAWESEGMNDAELAYYIEVQSRVAAKLAEVTQ